MNKNYEILKYGRGYYSGYNPKTWAQMNKNNLLGINRILFAGSVAR